MVKGGTNSNNTITAGSNFAFPTNYPVLFYKEKVDRYSWFQTGKEKSCPLLILTLRPSFIIFHQSTEKMVYMVCGENRCGREGWGVGCAFALRAMKIRFHERISTTRPRVCGSYLTLSNIDKKGKTKGNKMATMNDKCRFGPPWSALKEIHIKNLENITLTLHAPSRAINHPFPLSLCRG